MFKRILPLAMSLSLLIGCGSTTTTTPTATESATTEGAVTQIVTTTYPVYILASALTAGLDDVSVARLNTGDISCLHDYTLTVNDMKLIEGGDIIAMNGGDLEEFMADALAQTSALTIYCDGDIIPLYMDAHDHDHDHDDETEDDHDHDHDHDDETETVVDTEDDHDHDHDHDDETETVVETEDDHDHDHDHDDETETVVETEDDHDHDHDHDDETETVVETEDDHDHDHDDEEQTLDPHFWLSPVLYAQMADTLSAQLIEALPSSADTITANCATITEMLMHYDLDALSGISSDDFITFHDGFQYFADAFGLHVLAAIEEEAGSEASAQDIAEIIGYVNDYSIPAIFAEVNGSSATAEAIGRETGCAVYSLNMIMSGDDVDTTLSAEDILSTYYLSALDYNITTVIEAMK